MLRKIIAIMSSATVPDAPTIGTATAGDSQASVPFTAPANNGGSVITSYTATSTPGSITGTLVQAGSGTINVTGLTNGTAYTFTVHATNAIGNSAESSASNSVTPAYVVDAANFDGTNDYATRGAGLTGAADSKLWTMVFWAKFGATTNGARIFGGATAVGGSQLRFDISINASAKLNIATQDSGNGAVLTVPSLTSLSTSAWQCWMLSFDMADAAKAWMYLGDTADIGSASDYANASADLTLADWAVGAKPNGGNKLNADVAELYLWDGVYVNFSTQSNRRLFYGADGKPVTPAAAIAALGAPRVYFHLNDGETANNFVANDDQGATGGTFTVTGALSTSATSPSD